MSRRTKKPFLLLLSFLFSVHAQLPSTLVSLSNIQFNTAQSFISYFTNDALQVNFLLECTISTAHGYANEATVSAIAGRDATGVVLPGFLNYSLPNPAESYSLTCRMSMSIVVNANPQTLRDNVAFQTVTATDWDGTVQYSLQQIFSQYPTWTLSATLNRGCADGRSLGFNCDGSCQATDDGVSCYTCSALGAKVCCNKNGVDQSTCQYTGTTGGGDGPTGTEPSTTTDKNKETLYFWLMIGLAILAFVFLLILLILIVLFICCKRKEEKVPPSTLYTTTPTRPVVSAPVYLHTPPRDAKHGYRTPLPPAHHHQYANDLSRDADDSMVDEWTDPSARPEARV